jgi:hypothetical protein
MREGTQPGKQVLGAEVQEAKASFNGYFRSPGGNKDQFTLRQVDDQSDKEFIARVKQFVNLLGENGWKEWNGSDDLAIRTAAEQKNGNQETSTRNGRSFEIQSIQLAAGGDHPRWVVKGGKFKKFGVTCWPETLEAAGIAEKMDPLKENKPKGHWVAKYSERQNDEGKWVPDKVVALEKA